MGLYQSSFTARIQTIERDAVKQAKREERDQKTVKQNTSNGPNTGGDTTVQ